MRFPFLLIVVLIASQLPGQDSAKGTVEGTVVDELTGKPVRRANVELSGQRADKPPRVRPLSDEGRWQFPVCRSGIGQIHAEGR